MVVGADGSDAHVIYAPWVGDGVKLTDPDWQPCVAGVTIRCVSIVSPPTHNAPPQCVSPTTAATTAGHPIDLPAAPCADPEGQPIDVRIVSGPNHGTLSGPGPDGHRRYAPQAGFAGQDVIRFVASDGVADSNVATLTISILPGGASNGSSATEPGTAGASAIAPRLTAFGRRRLDRHGRAHVRVRCDVRCSLAVRLVARLRSGRRVRGPMRKAALVGRHTARLTLRLSRPGQPLPPRNRLRRVWVAGRVTGTNGAARTVTFAVRLARLR